MLILMEYPLHIGGHHTNMSGLTPVKIVMVTLPAYAIFTLLTLFLPMLVVTTTVSPLVVI